MKRSTLLKINSKHLPWLTIVFCWLTAFSISCLTTPPGIGNGEESAALADAVFTGSRQAFSRQFAETADVYFHRGVPHLHELAFRNSFYQRLARNISPTGHVHLEGKVVAESMPWYWMAIKLDPHNIQNYLVAAFWLGGAIDNIPIAHEVLQEARINTDLNHEVELEDAMLYIKEKKLAEAEKALDVALKIWPSGQNPEDESLLLDKIHILMFKALLREIDGDIEGSCLYFENILKITPEDTELVTRVKNLKERKQPSTLAINILSGMIRSRGNGAGCHRDHNDAPDHDCNDDCENEHH